jgi:xylulokinase
MPEPLRHVSPTALISGWDFSTGSVKCLAFDLAGNTVAEWRGGTDLWEKDGAVELNALQLEGQARASVRGLANRLRELGRLNDWLCGGISATHHSCGRIDADHNPVRRLICWNDQTLAAYHAKGMARLGGPDEMKALLGGPWAERYSLSHLVKDEETLSEADWNRTKWILPHGPMAAGFLTGRYGVTSVSSAASTGLMDFRTDRWRFDMLGAIASDSYRSLVRKQLPEILGMSEPIGPLAANVCAEANLPHAPLVFPTLDDQAAGLIGGGATDPGHVAVILGNSAVVNSSSHAAPSAGSLDAMKLNWGPYLWMRCYSNGAQFVDRVVGPKPDWAALEAAAKAVPAGCGGVEVLPFALSEPSVGVTKPRIEWTPHEPKEPGVRLRAAYEAVAYLIGLAVREHEAAGQSISRVTVSGGIARSELMVSILAAVLNRRVHRLVSSEGPALGAAVAALAGYETHHRTKAGDSTPFTAADAVATMVKFKDSVDPDPALVAVYDPGLDRFQAKLNS